MKLLFLLILLLVATPALAQRQNNIWYFGYRAGLDFNGPAPALLENGATTTPEGTSSICDPRTGELLFYTDGMTVWNAQNRPMPDGTGLMGHYTSTQSALIVPAPGTTSKYYIFTTGDAVGAPMNGHRYSIVDMTLDGGRGDVELKNQLLVQPAIEGQAAYRFCGPEEEYWLIGHGLPDRFYAYHITKDGIAPPVISQIGTERNIAGAMAFSPDGTMLATAEFHHGFVQIYRFDRTTGSLHSPITISYIDPRLFRTRRPYGVCFSPDNSKLYVSHGGYTATGSVESGVTQHDISTMDSVRIHRSAVRLATSSGDYKGFMQLGPDGRIYVACGFEMDLIQYPDSAGAACGYVSSAFDYTTAFPFSLPSFVYSNMDLYRAEVGSSATTPICHGDSAQLSAGGGVGYQWSPSTGLSCTECPNPIASPGQTTTYTVSIASRYGCPLIDSVTVEIIPPPTVDAGSATEICLGDSVRLDATGTGSFFWSPAAGLSCTDCPDPVASPESTTLYRLLVTSQQGCTAEDSVVVTVHPMPDADVAAGDTTICAGMSVQLTATGGSRYRWSPAEGLSCVDCADPVATPLVTTTYHLASYNEIDCAVYDSVTVHVEALPSLAISGDTTLCRGESTVLTATGASSYRWHSSEGLSCVDCATPVAIPTQTTTYYLTGRGSNGCEQLDSITIVVAEPNALRLSGDSTMCSGSQMTVVATGADTYLWSSPGRTLDCPTCAEQTLSPAESMQLYVEGRTKEGCLAVDSFRITVLQSPDLVVAGGGEICAGESRILHASGAVSYRWEPAVGLSCSDCPDPVASPVGTTSYRVIGSLPGGCADTAMVTLTVREREPSIASIERDVRVPIGESRDLSLMVDRALSADTIHFELQWQRGVVALQSVRLTAALLADGWIEETQSKSDASYHSRFVRSSPGLVAAGELARLTLAGYLGDSATSELPFSLTANSNCSVIETRAGSIIIDSICGLDTRMIVAMNGLLRLDLPSPHPLVGSATIRYAVPFDADEVDLRLNDVAGHSWLLGSGYHAAGEYEVVLDAAETPPGMYVIRLRVGELIRQVEVIVGR